MLRSGSGSKSVTKRVMAFGASLAISGTAFVALGEGTAFAATNRFVATTGSDTVPVGNQCTNPAQPCKTIPRAHLVSAAGDVIIVSAGTYPERITITKAITISGAGAASTIINVNQVGPANAPAVIVNASPNTAPVTISGVTITGGFANFGAGLQVNNGIVVVNDSTISGNKAATTTPAASGGGGIGVLGRSFTASQQLTLNRVTVSGNTTTARGGGIYAAGPVTINDSTFTGNSATVQGGGAYLAKLVAADTPTLTSADTTTGSTFSNNTSGTGGGVVVTAGGVLNLGSLASITGNTAVNGGGLYITEGNATFPPAGTVVLDGTTVTGNKANGGAVAAGGNGGAAFNSGSLTIQNHASFSGNQAVQSSNATNAFRGHGGAIVNVSFVGGNPQLTVSDSTITGGLPAGFNATFGGAISQVSPTPVSISNSTLTGNVGFNGGAIYAWTGVNLVDSAVTNNPAVVGGGAYLPVPLFAGSALTMNGGTLAGNTAANGGGLYVVGKGTGANAGTATLDSVDVTNNVADGGAGPTGGNGGGVFNAGNLTIRNGSVLSGNRVKASTASGAVTGYGGGVFNGPVALGDAPDAAINDSAIDGGTLPTGVTSHAVNGGAIANVGNVFGTTGTPAPTPGALTAARDTVTNNIAALNGGGLYNGGAATLTDVAFAGNSGAFIGGTILDGSTIATDSPTLTATDVDVTGSATPAFIGGGVAVLNHATLTATDGSIESSTSQAGGGLYVQEGGTATLDGTDLLNNTATGANGGNGGGALNSGTLTLRHSLVAGNEAVHVATGTGFGGGVYSGSNAGAPTTVALTVDASTFTDNTSAGGSAIITVNSASAGTANTANVTNSTLTGNQVVGTVSAGVIVAFHPMTITASTIDANTAPAGSGGIYGTATTVSGTILSANSGGSCGIVGAFVAPIDGGYNLTDPGDTTCGFSPANGNISANPQLGPLASNGGPTPTQMPGPSSPVINHIPPGTVGLCGPGATDQRGVARPQGSGCDIGAVEADLSAPTLAGPTTPTFVVGQADSYTYTTAGVPTPDLSATGTLPSGVTFVDNGDGTGTLAGTPAVGTGGEYPITVTASNGTSPDATLPVTVTVNEPPTISGPSGATTVEGVALAPVTFTTTGFPEPTLSVTSGTLPTGVTFVDNGDGTATISGTPTVSGTFPITITATNGTAPDDTHAFTLTVSPAVSIVTTALPNGRVGVTYSASLAATDGAPPYTWSISAGGLPAGLTLSADGTISGTPTGPVGTSTFTVMVQDSLEPAGTDTQELTITINKGPSFLAVSPVILQTSPLGLTVGILRAVLTGGSPAVPLAGQTIVFTAGATTVCTAVTNANGVATCQTTVANTVLVIANLGVTATYAGNALYQGSSGSAGLA
jgi:predicted outer membrane repeat protein